MDKATIWIAVFLVLAGLLVRRVPGRGWSWIVAGVVSVLALAGLTWKLENITTAATITATSLAIGGFLPDVLSGLGAMLRQPRTALILVVVALVIGAFLNQGIFSLALWAGMIYVGFALIFGKLGIKAKKKS